MDSKFETLKTNAPVMFPSFQLNNINPGKKNINEHNIQEENECNNNNNYEMDEYKGLMYCPRNNLENMFYYMDKEQNEENNKFKTKWKTEICHYWEMYGECKFGNNCTFAHGNYELKKRKMTFNYKTKPCKQFFELGYCSYGSRCQFSHKKQNLKDNKSSRISYLKIIKEFLSSQKEISHELLKRLRLMTFENITKSTLEESEKSKLELYEDIINLKNTKFKLSEDTNYSNISNYDNNCNNDNKN